MKEWCYLRTEKNGWLYYLFQMQLKIQVIIQKSSFDCFIHVLNQPI